MYNEAIKSNFLESISNDGTRIVAKSFLGKFDEVCASKFGKDAVDMNRDEILEAMGGVGHLNYTTLRTDLYILSKYVEWFNNNVHEVSIENVASISVRDIDLSESFRAQLIRDEDELTALVGTEFAKDGYLEVPVIIFSWLGLTMNEIVKLKNEDVIFKDDCIFIQLNKNIIRVGSEKLIEPLRDYKLVKSSIRSHRGDWVVYPDDLGYFIKNMITKDSKFTGRPLSVSRIRKRMEQYNRCVINNNKQITIDNTLLSGRLHRILEAEISTGKVLPEVVASELNIKLNIVNDGIAMYEAYKKAFNIKIEN